MRLITTTILTCLIAFTARADVLESGDAGFIVQHEATVTAGRAAVFETMTAGLGQWWNPDHSFSGDAANMGLDEDCYCERWDGNVVRHLDTVAWITDSKVIMQGGLGPLKELGLSGSMVWMLAPADNAGTTIHWKYHVYGNSETDMGALAAAVDGVLKEQLGRLVLNLEGVDQTSQ